MQCLAMQMCITRGYQCNIRLVSRWSYGRSRRWVSPTSSVSSHARRRRRGQWCRSRRRRRPAGGVRRHYQGAGAVMIRIRIDIVPMMVTPSGCSRRHTGRSGARPWQGAAWPTDGSDAAAAGGAAYARARGGSTAVEAVVATMTTLHVILFVLAAWFAAQISTAAWLASWMRPQPPSGVRAAHVGAGWVPKVGLASGRISGRLMARW